MNKQVARHCVYCNQALANYLPATRDYCGNIQCRAAWQKDLLTIQAEKQQKREQTLRTDIRKLALQKASQDRFDPDELAISLIPWNPYQVTKTSDQDIEAFTDYLSELIDSLDEDIEEKPHRIEIIDVPTHLSEPLATACSTCKGSCCLQGKETHAFLQRDTLKRVKQAMNLDRDALLAGYLKQLPEESFSHGCLYQSAEGCQLNKEWRAEICDLYFCDDLKSLIRKYPEESPEKHLIIATDSDRLMSATLLSDEGVQTVKLDDELRF